MADNLKPIDPIKLCINITIPSIDDDSVSLYEAVGILSKKMQEAIGQINASLGTLEGAYSAQNPPPYPVTSVNGKTGAVTVDIPEIPDNVYSSDNPPPYPVKSVNNAKTANIQTLFVPEGSTSGTLDDVSQEELIAACKAGATLAAVDVDNKTFKLYHLELLSNPERVEYYELAQGESAVTSVNGKDGQVVLTGADIAASGSDTTAISTKIVKVEGDIAELDAKADEAYSPNNEPPGYCINPNDVIYNQRYLNNVYEIVAPKNIVCYAMVRANVDLPAINNTPIFTPYAVTDKTFWVINVKKGDKLTITGTVDYNTSVIIYGCY